MQYVPQPPAYEVRELSPKSTRYCFLVTSWNEGDRIRNQLRRMSERASLADILIADGDSDDGSMDADFLRSCGVRTLLVTRERGLGTALRMGFDYALSQGYEGVVTVDGNGKDGVERLPDFLRLLDDGVDFIQGSRFLPGGKHEHTPWTRHLGVKLVVAPLLWVGGGRLYSDPTNGFKGLSRRYLTDPRVAPIRSGFERFNMQFYLNARAPRLGFRVEEIPVERVYPSDGSIPTKITKFSTKITLVKELLWTAFGLYAPKPTR